MADQQHPESIPRYPLEWPLGWKRTPGHQRERAPFTHYKQAITLFVAAQQLEAELDRIGAKHPTLSTNVSLRLDGRPRSDENPPDVGAAVYFTFKGKATVLACDRYTTVGGNVAAIARHIDALRRIERYGVGTIEQALAGYKALPADTAADWRSVFGLAQDLRGDALRDALDVSYKALAKQRHPDIAHDDGAAMAHLNRARDYALAELTA